MNFVCIGRRRRPFIAGYIHMMKIRSLPILAALAFTSAFASAQPPATPAKPALSAAKGIVNIVCNPSCDDVVVAGRSLGPSPGVRADLPAAAYDATP